MIKRILFLILATTSLSSLHGAPQPAAIWRTNAYGYWVRVVQFRPDGLALASASQNYPMHMWSITNSRIIRSFNLGQNQPVAAAFSADGTRIFGGNGSGPYRVWHTSDGAVIFSNFGASAGFGCVMYSANGLYMALGREHGTISLQDAVANTGINLLEGHEGMVNHLAFSPDSTLLGSSGADNTARLWRVSDGAMLQNFEYRGGAIAFTPDGKYFCYDNHAGGANFWDVQTNGIARTFPAWGSAVRFTADGKLLLTVNGPLINLWRVATGALVASYDTAPDGSALSLDVSPNGQLFAYGSYDGMVVLARMPVLIESIQRTGNECILRWQGGSGLYQLQSNPDYATNGWQNVGAPTTNTCATNVSSSTLFFRVQSLPNP